MLPLNLLASPLARYGVLAIGAIACVGGAYIAGRGHGAVACEQKHKAALAESLQRGLEQAQAIAREDAEITEHYLEWRTRYVTQLQTVPQEITNAPPTAADCDIGPDGLLVINRARSLSHGAGAEGTAPAVPAPAPGD